MAKEHFGLRIGRRTLERLRETARLGDRPTAGLAERYVEEGLRMDVNPGIYFVTGPMGRRPTLIGGPDVWVVVETIRNHEGSLQDAADYLELPLAQVQRAASYYGQFKDEIDDWTDRAHIAADREEERARQAEEAFA